MEYFLPFLWVYYYEDPVDPDVVSLVVIQMILLL